MDLQEKLNAVRKEIEQLTHAIGEGETRLKALNKLARSYVNLIKAAEELENPVEKSQPDGSN